MPNNYVLLEKITVGAAGAASVTFANIPQTGYTDLVLSTSNRITGSNPTINLRFNSDTTATNYYRRTVLSYGSGVSSNAVNDMGAGGYSTFAGYTASTFGSTSYYIPNYTGSNQKSYSTDSVTENNSAADYYSGLIAGLWTGTAAITSITIYPADSSNWVANSTFYLYGVAKLGTTPAIAPKAAGGDIVMTDGTYWYHAFRSSGTFTPAVPLSCDVLQVAGGGGGGSRSGGGGGAGGISYLASQSVEASAQTVTVGAGGTPGSRSVNGTNGSNSQFASLTAAAGGGVGGSALGNLYGTAGNSGGSGGGGCNNGTGGVGTSGQGFAGGSSNSSSYDAAGGGGAGAVGANASTGGAGSGAGAGGAGINTYSTWLNTTGTGVSGYIAGGGGGGSYGSSNHGAGGSGGGGAGADSAPTAGTANTGGGGGGAGNSANTNTTPTGAAGGSGLVIVRYLVA